jgi:hypothetical protein
MHTPFDSQQPSNANVFPGMISKEGLGSSATGRTQTEEGGSILKKGEVDKIEFTSSVQSDKDKAPE